MFKRKQLHNAVRSFSFTSGDGFFFLTGFPVSRNIRNSHLEPTAASAPLSSGCFTSQVNAASVPRYALDSILGFKGLDILRARTSQAVRNVSGQGHTFVSKAALLHSRSISSGELNEGKSSKVLRSFALTNFDTLTEGLPLQVRNTPGAGRGTFATRDIRVGEILLREAPVVAHPALDNAHKVCYMCLRSKPHAPCGDHPDLPGGSVRAHASGPSAAAPSGGANHVAPHDSSMFCSATCHATAEARFYGVERRCDWLELLRICRQREVKFPLVVRRLACMALSGAVHVTALSPLCHVELHGATPPPWEEERKLLVAAFARGGFAPDELAFLTQSWYDSVTARLHLNVFRVEMVVPTDASDLLAAAASMVDGTGSVGTAVYLLPSLLNHNCDPNVDATWPSDASLELRARRDIAAGEELCITYIDASMSASTRRSQLEFSYGFSCKCARCLQESSRL